jgi:hypothetical protein
MRDYHNELIWGLKRRVAPKPPTNAGYACTQWVRFIYGHEVTNSYGPLIGKLHAAIHPTMAKLYNTRS